jgi:hypothetical protein
MANLQHFAAGAAGTYKINNLTSFQHQSNGFKIIIGRSNRPNKPNKVLIFLNPTTGIREYISALFYVNETDYCFDCAGQVFRLSINVETGTVEVYPCKSCGEIIHQWYVNRKKVVF